MTNVKFIGTPPDGVKHVLADLAMREGEGGITAELTGNDGKTLSVSKHGSACRIAFGKRVHFFRALGLLAEHINEEDFDITEPVHFDMNGVMADVTQSNTMPTVAHAKMLLRRCAVMGLSAFMFYCEDGYEVPEWPYFSHMRARFTQAEMRELDDYAFSLGIELIPCIQTLAHLTEPLKWPCFHGMRESGACLLPGEDRVYRFIEDMIVAASSCVRTNRIHIGMDEAMGLGMGKYFIKHGLTDAGEIMLSHLDRVMEILRRHGLKPMMWCDMFYKRAFAGDTSFNQDYGAMKSELEKVTLCDGSETLADMKFIKAFPSDAQIIPYAYDGLDDAYFDKLLSQSRLFCDSPVFAGGIWGWTSFCPNWRLTFANAINGLSACKRNGVREVFATMWGDEQTECPLDALLLGMQLWAELGYGDGFDEQKLKARYEFITGADYEATVAMQELDAIPGCGEGNPNNFNGAKCLMWQDPLCGMLDKDLEGLEDSIEAHYSRLAALFSENEKKPSDISRVFGLYARLASVLADKATVGCRLKAAYDAGDRETLSRYVKTVLPRVIDNEKRLMEYHRDMFFEQNKAFGWETFELRYSVAVQRAETALWRLNGYLSGEFSELDELKEPRFYMHGTHKFPTHLCYATTISASRFTSRCGGTIK